MLLDIAMSQLDGYAVCEHIRRQSWGKKLPIIVLTGFGREADKKRSWVAAFDGHLLKPIDYTTFPEILAKTVATKKEER